MLKALVLVYEVGGYDAIYCDVFTGNWAEVSTYISRTCMNFAKYDLFVEVVRDGEEESVLKNSLLSYDSVNPGRKLKELEKDEQVQCECQSSW